MNTKYQLIFLGNKEKLSKYKDKILKILYQDLKVLGLDKKFIEILYENNFNRNYKSNAPAVVVYFGAKTSNFPNINEINKLIDDATFILPVVSNINNFTKLIPKELHPINGYELKNKNGLRGLVNYILEGLSLLRVTRRLFISYRREKSSDVAIQLFEVFEKYGFDVFLDTHSVTSGDDFQEELWHRLADTDVVVVLNTKDFLGSQWTKDEVAQASAMSIGILQLVWPNHTPEDMSKLTSQFRLKKENFVNKKFSGKNSVLENNILNNIVKRVESLRARSLAARQDNLITEFTKAAASFSVKSSLQPEKFITIDSKEYIIVPAVGVPHSFVYNKSEEFIKKIQSYKNPKCFLLYDHINIREKWLNHLDWLDLHLPIKSIKIANIDKWFQTN